MATHRDAFEPPPHDLAAEQACLGAALISRTAVEHLAERLTADDFYIEGHRKICAAILALHQRLAPVDFLTVGQELATRQELEGVGGTPYLLSLSEMLPTAEHVEYYARTVRDKSTLRRVIQAADKISAEAKANPESVDALVRKSEQRFVDLAGRNGRVPAEPLRDWLAEAKAKYDPAQGTNEGLKLGYPTFDRLTGGILPDDLIIGAARPSHGKSSFGLVAVAVNTAWLEGTTVLAYSHEMARDPLQHRFLANLSGISSKTIRRKTFTEEEWETFNHALEGWKGLNIYVHAVKDYNTPQELVGHARRELRDHPEIGLIIIDHLQEFELPHRKPEHQEIGDNVTAIKTRLCQGLGVPCLLLSQINRDAESIQRKGDYRPEVQHLKGSGKIEEKADHIFLFHRPSYRLKAEIGAEPDEGTTEFWLAKCRNGQVGQFKLHHSLSKCQYREEDEHQDEAPPEAYSGRAGY